MTTDDKAAALQHEHDYQLLKQFWAFLASDKHFVSDRAIEAFLESLQEKEGEK